MLQSLRCLLHRKQCTASGGPGRFTGFTLDVSLLPNYELYNTTVETNDGSQGDSHDDPTIDLLLHELQSLRAELSQTASVAGLRDIRTEPIQIVSDHRAFLALLATRSG